MFIDMKALSIVSSLFVVLGLIACEETSNPDGNTNVPPIEVGQPGTPDNEPACPTTTTGPTLHKGDIAADETWTAETGPHVIEGTVSVRNGVKLTIAPCVEVRVAKGHGINVAYPITPNQGTLIAEGTAKRPIKIVSQNAGERWTSIAIHAPGTARLAHVTLENGGGGDFQEGATISVYGDSLDGADPLLFTDHVTIAKSLGLGAWLTRGATFMTGSRDLTIKEAGSYPIQIEEHALDALPTGTYTGNANDRIFLDPRGGRTGGSGLLADGTMHDRGVPYKVGKSKGQSFIIGGREDEKLVTLTIEPGVIMEMVDGGALKVQHFTTTKPSTAAIKAVGTAEKPIVIRSASPTPKAGDWVGLWFGGIPDASNEMSYVRIEHAGGDCGCILNTCSAITQHEGAVIFTQEPKRAFITNTTFKDISGHGITQGYDGAFVDFKATNDFSGVTGCAQTRPRLTTTQCPSPRPACE